MRSILCTLVLAAAAPAWAADIVVGQSAPLTGGNAELGNDIRNGALAYFRKVNESGVLPAKIKLAGKRDVSVYFGRYSESDIAWRVKPALAEGRAALLATNPDDIGDRYIILLGWSDGRIITIRDFLHARYVMDGIDIADI